MLLKVIPIAEQQELVTDRALSSTAILYKLMIRFQPGGPGEKQILLQQLTTMPKVTTIQDVASALTGDGRAQEVQAVLPDGVLLLKALDEQVQKIASLDPQAAFRLAQSRMQLQLDERPDHHSLWSFSQCLLAEAETLSLLQTTPTSTTSSSPLKLKQLQGDQRPPLQTTSPDQRARTGATVDKPCKYFLSDAGCKAGRSCRWQHSWEGVEDKASRCLICGGKDHRKNECKLKAGKRQGEPAGGSGGGRGAGSPATSSNATGGKAGAAAVKIAKAAGDVAATTTTSNADVTMVTSSTGGYKLNHKWRERRCPQWGE